MRPDSSATEAAEGVTVTPREEAEAALVAALREEADAARATDTARFAFEAEVVRLGSARRAVAAARAEFDRVLLTTLTKDG